MNKKALALIIGGLVVLAAIIYFVFFFDFSGSNKAVVTPPQSQSAEPVVSKSEPTKASGETATAPEQSRDAAEKMAIYFADRFGSSSNQADFSNLTDLEVFMTDAMIARTRDFVAKERAKTPATSQYEGITTKAVIVEFTTYNEATGSADGIVKTKRQKTVSNGEKTSYDQQLSISLKKVKDVWKVDRADWK